MTKEQKPFDKLLWGFVPALFLPLFSIFILFAFQQDQLNNISFTSYLNYIIHYKLISKVMSVTAISNLAIFYLFLQTERYKAVRGVISATLVYVVAMLLFMFVIK